MQIPYFRGVFCRDQIPKKINKNEVAICNLDISKNEGTHWIAYVKKNKLVYYYDSFGNLQPPPELKKYFNKCDILYNNEADQTYNSVNCGHLCLKFIKQKTKELFK